MREPVLAQKCTPFSRNLQSIAKSVVFQGKSVLALRKSASILYKSAHRLLPMGAAGSYAKIIWLLGEGSLDHKPQIGAVATGDHDRHGIVDKRHILRAGSDDAGRVPAVCIFENDVIALTHRIAPVRR